MLLNKGVLKYSTKLQQSSSVVVWHGYRHSEKDGDPHSPKCILKLVHSKDNISNELRKRRLLINLLRTMK